MCSRSYSTPSGVTTGSSAGDTSVEFEREKRAEEREDEHKKKSEGEGDDEEDEGHSSTHDRLRNGDERVAPGNKLMVNAYKARASKEAARETAD